MAAPITPEQRQAVLTAARSGASRNDVARQTGVSTATVSRVCAKAGVTFDRTRTAVAVQARVIDLKAARVHLAGALLDDVAHARTWLRTAVEARDLVDAARAVSLLAGAHVRLVQVDGTDEGVEEGRDLITALMQNLGMVHRQQQAPTDDDTEDEQP